MRVDHLQAPKYEGVYPKEKDRMSNVDREIVMNDILYERTPQKVVKSRHDPSPDHSQLYVNKTAVSSAQGRPAQHQTSRKRSNI